MTDNPRETYEELMFRIEMERRQKAREASIAKEPRCTEPPKPVSRRDHPANEEDRMRLRDRKYMIDLMGF